MKALLVTLAVLLSPVLLAKQEGPTEVITSAVEQLSAKLEGRQAEYAENREALYALIDEILLPRFDRKFAAQIVLAKHWRTANAAQRERFVAAFYQALLRRYADGILEFEQDRVAVLPYTGDAGRPRAKVRTTVLLNDGSKVAVDYELVKRDSGWKLFNVVIEGVSYVRNFRAELDSEIRSSSLDAVIARLESEANIGSSEGDE